MKVSGERRRGGGVGCLVFGDGEGLGDLFRAGAAHLAIFLGVLGFL